MYRKDTFLIVCELMDILKSLLWGNLKRKDTKPKFATLSLGQYQLKLWLVAKDAQLPWQQAYSFITLVFEVISTSYLVQLSLGAVPTHSVAGCWGNLVTMATNAQYCHRLNEHLQNSISWYCPKGNVLQV